VIRRFAVRLLLLLVLAGGIAGRIPVFEAAAHAQAQPPRTAAQDGFVPVDQLPVDERLPAAPLLIAAYSVAWIAVVVYLVTIWQRLARVEREMADVRRRVKA
jgi:CcmD family protein